MHDRCFKKNKTQFAQLLDTGAKCTQLDGECNLEVAFGHVNLDWRDYVKYDARYERPAEVDLLIGDPAKAKKQLCWEPKVKFAELARIMVDADLAALQGLRWTPKIGPVVKR